MHRPCLAKNLVQLGLADNRFGTIVQFALTARSQLHSGLVARLEHSQGRQPQGHEKRDSPGARDACREQRSRKHDTRAQRYEAKREPLATLPRPHVRDGHGCEASIANAAV